jgi:hypothetical protein
METVECLSGSMYAERPLALRWEGERLEIEAILSQWRTAEERWFRVRTRDGRTFDLAYNEGEEGWKIHPITGG